jgi:CRISPR-associated endonuclease Csn1
MKKILGLDLGTTSIGWAYVNEAENEKEESEIIDMGVRIVPLTSDEENDFAKGNTISVNANRTLKRGARRNLQRFKQRRNALLQIFKTYGFIPPNFQYAEDGTSSTFSTLKLRAKAADEQISKEELVKVLLQINKKRGYKSSRKAQADDEGQAIDSMGIAKELYEKEITPGQYTLEQLKQRKLKVPDFYRSDLREEFNIIVQTQKIHHPEIFTDEFIENIVGKNSNDTKRTFNKADISLVEVKGKRNEKKLFEYKLRDKAVSERLELPEIAFILSQINGQINASSGYLGAISDRSKELYFNNETVGQNLYKQIQENPHTRIKGQVFYRQDYMDEFERIWETQMQYHPELKEKLKKEVRDVTIFYQRPLKSQKHLISKCEFEPQHKVVPKSHPLFQEFRTWQNLNNLLVIKKADPNDKKELELDLKKEIADELAFKANISEKDLFAYLPLSDKTHELNFPKIEGNRTNNDIFEAFAKIIEMEDGEPIDLSKIKSDDILDQFSEVFLRLGINTDLLKLDEELEGEEYEKQAYIQFWHLIYSAEENENLKKNLIKKFGFKDSHCKFLLNIGLQEDHAGLSSKAIKKILPHLKDGLEYSEACKVAGYNHSSSLTKDQNEERVLTNKIELLKKNSLRNPVVEKILNQMINVVNAIIDDPNLGKPDEIRVEMARELKANADQRKKMTSNIASATITHEKYRKILKEEFGLPRVTRNDLIRYKLWLETDGISLYTGKPIEASKLFSKEYDIEHIIPKSRLFDDSFSNKTLCERQLNIDKSNSTAFSFLEEKFPKEEFEQYQERIKSFYNKISKTKIQKLLMSNDKIPEDFIERQKQETRYISRKAIEVLFDVVRKVTVTTGSVTSKLREDWGLIEVMKELNWDKYNAIGLTYIIEGKNGEKLRKIKDWTKRNDHRHHAMDALAVALTKPVYIQYLNRLNARGREDKKGKEIYGIEQKYLERVNGKFLFKNPIKNIREEAKNHLSKILISYKAKNKVVTINTNKTKKRGGYNEQKINTPRAQLHKETVYGKSHSYKTKLEKIGTAFDYEKINTVAKKAEREALINRLDEFNGDAKKAFTGKNTLSKNPLYLSLSENIKVDEKVKTVQLIAGYTIRKAVSPDLKLDKVVDVGIKRILQSRLDEYNGNAKEAFGNLEDSPIWQNEEKGIAIKTVKISGVSNAEVLHVKRDHYGNPISDNNGNEIPADYVSTGNNHHVAIYRDEKGNLQDEVITFYEAVIRKNQNLPVIKRQHEKGWEFLYSIKQNEYFIFPGPSLNPNEIDLMNPNNFELISPFLFRAQKFSKLKYGNSFVREYVFRHHLETTLNDKNELKDITFFNIKSLQYFEGMVKVRINHLGKIVQVGGF